ncbi:MAG: class I SAM-dependent methyltransferase [Gammaproteobacteria bacterium]|nr:class I SAM-dependent methyltransferase [Gammaproteobacteria bacterium]MCP5425582.1 class I SAM-dependent methyltransferase [Gammaproteobacteria bacterium]MCP5459018.1 class I SAM-dependent methyltransferase [Gammaproteobacteria bacterium]
MNQIKTFQDKSYQRHLEHFREYTKNGAKAAHARIWFDKDSVDAWRHQRMYQTLNPLLVTEPQAKWLTVGDGRYGKDAKYIEENGCNALATDISEYLLKEAKDIGYITNYKIENAESLSFQDSTFDYVFCKESYHHFPRPMLALYEMMRVAKKGVVLIEPNDPYIVGRYSVVLFKNLKDIIKKVLKKDINKHGFEESGNYVYSISRREVEKAALGLNYKTVAFKGINDAYISGVEHEKILDNGPLQKKVKRLIAIRNFLCKLGFFDYGLLASIIFKKEPSPKLLQQLVVEGYEIVQLPNNPYISD